jgi:hypothetical protein
MASIRMEFSRSGRQTEVIERTYFSIRPTMSFISPGLSSWIWNLGYGPGNYMHCEADCTLARRSLTTSSRHHIRVYIIQRTFLFQRMVVALETTGLKAMQRENGYMKKSWI